MDISQEIKDKINSFCSSLPIPRFVSNDYSRLIICFLEKLVEYLINGSKR